MCAKCNDTGFVATADPENGPDFDIVSLCDCAEGDRVWMSLCEADDRAEDEPWIDDEPPPDYGMHPGAIIREGE